MSRSLIHLALLAALAVVPFSASAQQDTHKPERPNILFAIADDWGWPHAGAYGDPVVKTPSFDRIAKEGVLFDNAYVSSPSCTPSRNAILTGQWHWCLGPGANLWSTLDPTTPVYTHLLAAAGYHVGSWRKSWGPGRHKEWKVHPGGKVYRKGFDAFLRARPKGKPFCFWLGASDPHRPYKKGSGKASGMDLDKIKLFAHFPDSEEVRSDVADYYFEVQRFDRDVGKALATLEEIGELDNTIVVMTGDHGMPFPRCKANVYDSGARVPLAIRWPKTVTGGRTVTDFVSLTDLAPTFLELAGVARPDVMTGKSLLPILRSKQSGRIDKSRSFVLCGKERHVPAQEAPDMGGTPMRSIRTDDFLYIRNFEPDRWPAGTPNYEKATIPGNWLADCDNGPTKTYIVEHKDDDAEHRRFYDLSFAKRPLEELYDLSTDPDQLVNVASVPRYKEVRERLWKQLRTELVKTGDPRVGDGPVKFDDYPYYGGGPKHPSWRRR